MDDLVHNIDDFASATVNMLAGLKDVPKVMLTVGDMVLELAALFNAYAPAKNIAVIGSTYETGTDKPADPHPATPAGVLDVYNFNALVLKTGGGTIINSLGCDDLKQGAGTIGLVAALGLDPGSGNQEARVGLYKLAAQGALPALAVGGVFLLGQWGDQDRIDWWNSATKDEGVDVRKEIADLGYVEHSGFPFDVAMLPSDPVKHHLTAKGDVAVSAGHLAGPKFAKLRAQDENIIWIAFVKE